MFDRVAFLRAVNVGGRWLSMDALRELFVTAGFNDVRTLLQSGNVLFTAGRESDAELERRLEAATEERFRFATTYCVRTATELASIVAANPFKREAKNDPARLHVYFLKKKPDAAAAAAACAAAAGPERMLVIRREAYVYYPNGAGRSKFKVPWLGTGRNWNTVRKALALMSAG